MQSKRFICNSNEYNQLKLESDTKHDIDSKSSLYSESDRFMPKYQ